MLHTAVLVSFLFVGGLSATGLLGPILSFICNVWQNSHPTFASTIDVYGRILLRYGHRVPHSAGQKPIPTARFTWPNGQGTEKFFDGRNAALRWRDQFGPIYRIWSGFKPEIVLSKPSHVQQFYRDSHLHIKAKDNNSGWLFGELLGQCVGLVSQDRWRTLRQEVDPPFAPPAAAAHTRMLVRQAREYIGSLPLIVAASSAEGGGQTAALLCPADDLKLCPFYMVAEIFFGRLSPQRRAALAALAPLREDLFKHAFRGGVNRYALGKHLPGSEARARLDEFQDRWHAFVREAYEAVQTAEVAAGGKAPPIVELWEAVERGRIPMVEFMQTLDESLYANLDVTTHAVAWNVILIAQHPEVQNEVRAEILQAATGDDRDSSSYERYINSNDTLLAACVVEAARVRPILPFSNPEAATDDKVIDGYLIPGGTDVIVDTHAINVANPFWEDGEKYMPRRHMSLSKQQIRYNMWRYGFGPRQCLGKNVADRLLRAIIAETLTRMELRLPQATGKQEFPLQDESWVGLPSTKVVCKLLT
ncbi:putative cytochrome P450 oxidoreductase [Macrophomina phaseolina]|uniref:Cytochrome P450 oxidoreductase n=1 Tax=Macrophomina phaseolina TaxID=35725 RepID=A0ABQ8G8C0_9PEZI|nr:putative cytochrome P450 oxidoreductase [Macrophomina phaseolina]